MSMITYDHIIYQYIYHMIDISTYQFVHYVQYIYINKYIYIYIMIRDNHMTPMDIDLTWLIARGDVS
jgi:hypothetical protein